DTKEASETRPAALVRIDTLHAQDVPRKRVTSGSCAEVATGSTIPPGATAVVRVEDTDRDGEAVKIFAPVRIGQNVVRRGSGVRRSDGAPSGTRQRPHRLHGRVVRGGTGPRRRHHPVPRRSPVPRDCDQTRQADRPGPRRREAGPRHARKSNLLPDERLRAPEADAPTDGASPSDIAEDG